MNIKNDRLNRTVAVIRSYNNSSILSQLVKLLEFLPYVIVVVDSSKDNDVTKNALSLYDGDLTKITVLYMETGYSWSRGLNHALQYIDLWNADSENYHFDFMLNVSVEAGFERSYIERILSAFDNTVAVVGTTFEGYQDGKIVSLGSSYNSPRNTGMVVNLSCFSEEDSWVRRFDTFCDLNGGMEDYDFCERVWIFKGLKTKILDLKVPLTVGVHHNQAEKEKGEQQALNIIIDRYSEWNIKISRLVGM